MLIQKFLLLFKHQSVLIIGSRSKWTTKNVKLFAELFEMSLKDCKSYRCEKKVPPLCSEQIKATAAFCESNKIPKSEWLQFPTLLTRKTETLQQQYLQLKEGGFTQVDANLLAHYRRCTHQKVSYLKLCGVIPNHVSVAESFSKHLNPRPKNLLLGDLTDDHNFGAIHHSILTRYLMWKCDASRDAIEKFYRVYSLSKVKSFHVLCQNFAMAEELGFPPKKLLKYGYLLTNYPKYTRTILTEMPIVAGLDIRKAMKMYPKLIGTHPKHIREIYDYLKKEKVSDETIQKCMNIFHISPKTVKARLEEIRMVPELRVLLNNPRVLKLIIHHNEARSRLSFLQHVKLKCATTRILGDDQETFNLHLRGGKDINNATEVSIFVKGLLKTDDNQIETNLKRNRYYRHVPLLEIERSCKFLKKCRFTNKSIANVTQVLLYPSCKLQEALNKIKECSYLNQQKMDLVDKLNLVLYFIEKEHHFTGNGIFSNAEETA